MTSMQLAMRLVTGCVFFSGLMQTIATTTTRYRAVLLPLSGSGVTGEVIVTVTSTGLTGAGMATGLETSLSATSNGGLDCTATNGCGAHVHSGSACTNTSTQGGHYYDGTADPWASIGYASTDANGVATFSFVVTDSATSIAGRPFLVHNNAGGRVACGILTSSSYPMYSASLSALGDSGVLGSVTIFPIANGLFGMGSAAGLEPSLSDSSNGGSSCNATNGCGVHVHSGSACTDKSSQGGHYYNGDADPWASIRYSSTSANGAATFSFAILDRATDIAGKPFILHNNAGGRVSCGVLAAPAFPVYTASLSALGNSGVDAEVTIFATPTGLLGVGTATGLEASISASSNGGANCTATNGCGAHVHSGSACTDTSTQGGHYYMGTADPWASIGYSSTDANGVATFSFVVTDAATSIAGKPFIIHNNAGGRVSCGLLQGATVGVSQATLDAFGSSSVLGSVTTYSTSSSVAGGVMLFGLESDLSATSNGGSDCTATNGCGAHVHSGTACTDTTSQGGHFFVGGSDPWASISYPHTDSTGVAAFAFKSTNAATDVAGKPFVAHNNAGGRVSCGLLKSGSESEADESSSATSRVKISALPVTFLMFCFAGANLIA